MKKLWLLLIAVLVLVVGLWIARAQRLSRAEPDAATGVSSASLPIRERELPVPQTEPTVQQDSIRPGGTNAADLYKRAYALLNNLSEEEKQLLKSRNKSDPAKAAALLEKIQPILALLKQGAKADYCDWAFEDLTLGSPWPHLEQIYKLGNLTTWAAAQLFPQNPEAALELLSDQASLGDSVSNYALVGALVQNSLESKADALIRENFSSLTPELIEKYKSLLGSSPAGRDFPEAFQAEVAFGRDFLRNPSGDDPRVAEFQKKLQAFGSPERLDRIMDFYQQGSKMLEYSDAEFAAWEAQLKSMAQGTPLETILIFPEKFRSSFQKRITEREMLMGAIGILQNPRLAVSNQQFIYRETAKGFELESRRKFKGKPVLMSFPRKQ